MIGCSINPTTLTVGKTGLLDGHRATVVGRAVLQSADSYHWYEYYVELEGGRMIILVYEGGIWKRFDEFTPDPPLTAKDAESYGVGAPLKLHGKRTEVKYVSSSRVVYSEGKTWDGVRAGSAAQYFNAESDGEMIVVSWTGDEVECFSGKKVSTYLVAHAFKLPEPSFWKKLFWGGSGSLEPWLKPGNAIVVLILLFVVGVPFLSLISDATAPTSTVGPAPIVAPPAIRLADGTQGTLGGEHYTIVRHSLVEIDEMGERFQRYEYALVDGRGDAALLVQDLTGNPHDWVLFRTTPEAGGLVSTVAATYREGMTVRLAGADAKVQRLFLSRLLDRAPALVSPPPPVSYGFLARSADTWLLARWDEQTLDLEKGQPMPEPTVLSAFSAAR